jgi:dihydrofolate reductase
MQAPGGPEEDPTGRFSLGGGSFSFWDEVMGQSMSGFDGNDRELVLGRKTHEIFEAYWPYQPADDPTAMSLNGARKHVASRTLKTLSWNKSSLLGDDVVAAISALKSRNGHDLQLIGSGNLIQTLQAASLIDEYNIWIFPVVLGRGRRLFETTAKPGAMRLVTSHLSTTGVLLTTYVPAGAVPIGSFAQAEPSANERERRAKMADERTEASNGQSRP